jgi:phytoene dehydrogenase-like protein
MDASSATRFDAVVVGSGINSLAAGALLAKAGWRVCILEQADRLGGAIWTAEITEPGFVHEVFAAWHPLWVGSAAHAALGEELARRGVEYLNTDLPTATLYPSGESAFLTTSHEENVAALGTGWEQTVADFMPNADLAFGLLGTELWSRAGVALGIKAYRRLGRHGLAAFAGGLLASCRDWVRETFESEAAHGLFAPWVLHTGLGPDAAGSGFMAQVIAVAIELGGMPVPRGGGARLVEALAGIVRDAGGGCDTGRRVERIVVAGGRATGVQTADGEVVAVERAVLANVTPQALYLSLLDGAGVPAAVTAEASRFRYGRGEMQIHYALSEPPRWAGDGRLARTALVHLTPGLDGVSRAVNEAERGLLPAEATIVCGQPLAVDSSRAPDGKSILWIQLQEVPSRPVGDAAGELDVGDGTWTEQLREAYADRIQARLARHVTNLDSAILRRVVFSPADIEAANPNLRGGDIYGGSCALDQNLIWRPRPALPGHRTAIEGLYHIGASTHPGPGLAAGSGTLVAQELLRPKGVRDRVLARLR